MGLRFLRSCIKGSCQIEKTPLVVCSSVVCSVAFFFWTKPIYEVFVLGFYAPIEWPDPYDNLQAQLQALPKESKVLYLPAPDFATQPNGSVASPDFNITTIQDEVVNKGTGDHMCFDTRVDTIFPFEGNDMMVMRYLEFIHHELDTGNVQDLAGILSKAGLTHVVMRSDYAYHKERYDQYYDLLMKQPELEKVWEDEYMSLFENKASRANGDYFEHMTYTTGGLERFHWLARYFNTGTQNVNVLFAYDGHNPTIDLLRPGEIVDYTTYSDLLMSQVNKDLFVYPADPLRSVTLDRSWAKLKLAGHDWKQASRIYELNNHKYMFDMGHGGLFYHLTIVLGTRISLP